MSNSTPTPRDNTKTLVNKKNVLNALAALGVGASIYALGYFGARQGLLDIFSKGFIKVNVNAFAADGTKLILQERPII